MIIELTSIIVVIATMTFMFQNDLGFLNTIFAYLDIPSLMCILFLSLPILLKNGLWRDFLRAFKLLHSKYNCSLGNLRRSLDAVELMQKQILYAGIILITVTLIYLLRFTTTLELMGPYISITLIISLYTAILELLLLPLQLEIKRRIIRYMEED